MYLNLGQSESPIEEMIFRLRSEWQNGLMKLKIKMMCEKQGAAIPTPLGLNVSERNALGGKKSLICLETDQKAGVAKS